MNLKGCLFYCFSVNKYSNLLKLNKIVYKMRLIKFIRAVQCQKVIFGYSAVQVIFALGREIIIIRPKNPQVS